MKVPGALANDRKRRSGQSIRYREMSLGVIKQIGEGKMSAKHGSVPLSRPVLSCGIQPAEEKGCEPPTFPIENPAGFEPGDERQHGPARRIKSDP